MSKQNLIFDCTLFDMDGTLIDTTPAVTELWEEYAATYGLDAQEVSLSTTWSTFQYFLPI
jgi:beta-phosphoglucomutase-like phosphatase (HAD superfamily)